MSQIETSWEEYGSNSVAAFIRPNNLSKGDIITGIVDRIEEELGKFKKPCLFLQLTEPLTYDGKTYNSGESVAVNMPGQLKRAVDQADLVKGQTVQLIYSGMEQMNTGEFKGSEAHTFRLRVAVQKAAALAG